MHILLERCGLWFRQVLGKVGVDYSLRLGYEWVSILFPFPPQERDVFSSPAVAFLPIDQQFPIGSLVWGKLPGYDWWPGCVISYDKKDSKEAERDEEEEEEDDGRERDNGKVAWVKWYGDNQLSQVRRHLVCVCDTSSSIALL